MSGKLIAGLIIGAGAALAIGYLMTDEGSEMRKNITDALNKGKEFIKDNVPDIAGKMNAVKDQVVGASRA